MKITALKTFMQRVGNRPRLLVKVDTDAGISGWGEAYNHGPGPRAAAVARLSVRADQWH